MYNVRTYIGYALKMTHSPSLSTSQKLASGMRPWKRVFSVLRSHLLYLYKDKREAVLHGATLGRGARSANCEDEQLISIHSCLVDIAYSETKRKHVLRLTTQDFCEYLLQAEDREDMLSWIKVICENSRTDSEVRGPLSFMSVHDSNVQHLTAPFTPSCNMLHNYFANLRQLCVFKFVNKKSNGAISLELLRCICHHRMI